MGCSGCSTGRGCSTVSISLPGGCKNNGSCGVGGCNKLNVFDWLANMELPGGQAPFDIVELRFKNSRKGFYRNVEKLSVVVGDVLAVETPTGSGYDIGVVSLSGELVRLQMKKKNVRPDSEEIRKILRKAKPFDIDRWQEGQKLEYATMHRARTFAVQLKLQMKISDVEYQGDRSRAIFYYTAEDRVDFRELIKVLADEFKVKIEMKQIGQRQEAGRLGAIGSCGRELCCSTWLTDFRSVSTSAARYQQLSLNPLKLAGQCGKLKCCLNFELDSYLDALKDFPNVNNVMLETERGRAFHQKTDIFRRTMFFSYTFEPDNFISMTVDRVKEVMEMNAKGEKPAELTLKVISHKPIEKTPDYENVVGQDSVTRFDKSKKKKGNNNNNNNRNRRKPQGPGTGANQNAKPNQPTNPNQTAKPNQQAKTGQAANTNPKPNPNPNPNQGAPRQNNNRPNRNNRPRPNNNSPQKPQ